jgi:hypothetical protein
MTFANACETRQNGKVDTRRRTLASSKQFRQESLVERWIKIAANAARYLDL